MNIINAHIGSIKADEDLLLQDCGYAVSFTPRAHCLQHLD